jgi:hypothetical protein
LSVFRKSFEFELFSTFSLVCCFSCHLLGLRFFLFLDDLLDLLFVFWSSSRASCVLDSKIKLWTFLLSMYSSRGEIEKPSGQYLGLICDK